MKKYWLVSQTYHRYNHLPGPGTKVSLLLTDYDNFNMAKTHLQALANDKYAALIDLQRPAHKDKLLELVDADSRYHVFWAVVKSVKEMEEKVNRSFKDHMRRYIENHTTWRINRETTLRPSLQLVFGELFIVLKYGSHTIRVKFEDIETA